MESFSPEYGVFSLPYLFATVDEYYRVMDNPQVRSLFISPPPHRVLSA